MNHQNHYNFHSSPPVGQSMDGFAGSPVVGPTSAFNVLPPDVHQIQVLRGIVQSQSVQSSPMQQMPPQHQFQAPPPQQHLQYQQSEHEQLQAFQHQLASQMKGFHLQTPTSESTAVFQGYSTPAPLAGAPVIPVLVPVPPSTVPQAMPPTPQFSSPREAIVHPQQQHQNLNSVSAPDTSYLNDILSFDCTSNDITIEDILKNDPFLDLKESTSNIEENHITNSPLEEEDGEDLFTSFIDDSSCGPGSHDSSALGLGLGISTPMIPLPPPPPIKSGSNSATTSMINHSPVSNSTSPRSSNTTTFSFVPPSTPGLSHSGSLVSKSPKRLSSSPSRALRKARSFSNGTIMSGAGPQTSTGNFTFASSEPSNGTVTAPASANPTQEPQFSLSDCSGAFALYNYSFVFEQRPPPVPGSSSKLRRKSLPKIISKSIDKPGLRKSQLTLFHREVNGQPLCNPNVMKDMNSGMVVFQLNNK